MIRGRLRYLFAKFNFLYKHLKKNTSLLFYMLFVLCICAYILCHSNSPFTCLSIQQNFFSKCRRTASLKIYWQETTKQFAYCEFKWKKVLTSTEYALSLQPQQLFAFVFMYVYRICWSNRRDYMFRRFNDHRSMATHVQWLGSAEPTHIYIKRSPDQQPRLEYSIKLKS